MDNALKISNPAKFLNGEILKDTWKVVELIKDIPNGSGGNFSYSYHVEHLETQEKAFLKALDFSIALRDPDPLSALARLTDVFQFEQSVLEICKNKRLSKVVTLIDHGTIPATDSTVIPVPYFIMELANGNIRGHIDFDKKLDHLVNLHILHNTAIGLSQLHKNGVSHQDIKPSNILVFNSKSHKLGDLGRADVKSIESGPFSKYAFAGDLGYAPPEALYKSVPEDWVFRRLACDAYQLGSLIVFLYTNSSLTALLKIFISPDHNWNNWALTYEEVLPYLNIAMELAIDSFKSCVDDEELANELSILIFQLCNPNPYERGHPKSISTKGNSLSLERYVTVLDKMVRKYEIKFLVN